MSKGKPRLSQRAWQMLLAMHAGLPGAAGNRLAGARNELIEREMLCYSEGWKLTKRGKDIARHLTGRL